MVLLGSLLDKVLYFLPEKQRLSFAQSGHINETAAPMEAERGGLEAKTLAAPLPAGVRHVRVDALYCNVALLMRRFLG